MSDFLAETIDSIQYVTQYTYDQNGNVKTMTYPSGRVITYSLSNDKVIGVLNNAANLATNINYKPFGGMSTLVHGNGIDGMSTIVYGNGIVGTIGYDNQYRISTIQASGIMNLTSVFDANGNITAVTNNLDATKNKSFTYDALDRLATANGPWGSLGWTYDGVGNRLTENANSYTYFANSNKLSSANGKTFGYDNNGNTTTESARQYTYNQNQRLIQVVDGAMTAGYTYNGNGLRVKKVVNGTTTVFHYDLRGQLIAESDGTGATTAEYVYLNSAPLAKIEGANVFYYHADHLGTPQKMTDSTGAVVWNAEYKPFGEATIDPVSTVTNNLRYTGQYNDVETGLNYNLNRVYNPTTGRYDEADPWYSGIIQMARSRPKMSMQLLKPDRIDDIGLYSYASNNPLRFIDPRGLSSAYDVNIVCGRISLTNYFLCTKINNNTCPPTLTFLGIFEIENAPCIGACIFTEQEWNTHTTSPWAT